MADVRTGSGPLAGTWIVPASALIAAVVGSFAAASIDLLVVPRGTVGGTTGMLDSGLPATLLAFYFAIPLAALVASAVAYWGVAHRRPVPFAVAAVVLGTLAGAVVGFLVPALGTWWLSLPSDTNQTAVIVTVVEVLPISVAVGLAAKLPVLGLVPTRRGRVAAVLSVGALAGLFVGLFVGGVAGALTGLQNPCAALIASCQGLSVTEAISSGSALGAWFGAGTGVGGAALAWAIPPWRLERTGPDGAERV